LGPGALLKPKTVGRFPHEPWGRHPGVWKNEAKKKETGEKYCEWERERDVDVAGEGFGGIQGVQWQEGNKEKTTKKNLCGENSTGKK